MRFISHAQNYEDVMLVRALGDVPRGFYIDVGANDPDLDSVTRAFYELGWSGINVEPVPKYHEALCAARPRDINLRIVIGDADGERDFHDVVDTGLSTLDATIADRHRRAGWQVRPFRVSQRRLRDVWAEHVSGEVHFLKIDVEGAEADALRGCDLVTQRPWIIVVEAIEPLTSVSRHDAWEPLLTAAAYEFVYFDGLNRYYLAAEHADRRERFLAPPNVFDDFVRAGEYNAVRQLAEMRERPLPAVDAADMATRVARIEQTLSGIAKEVASMVQMYREAVQDVLCSQVAYLGDHRALTYLRTGHKIFVDTRSIDIGSQLLLGGVWENHYATAFCPLLRPGDSVLDIGANQGVYTVLAGACVGLRGHVYAFEPSSNFYELLRATVHVNGLDAVVTLAKLAVADAARDVNLVYDRYWSGAGHLASTRNDTLELHHSGQVESEMVHCVSLDEHFGTRLAKIDAMKMDIEGAEGLALKGMAKLIDRSPRLKIMMEFCVAMLSRYNCDARFVVEFFREREFICWTIKPDGVLAPANWEALFEDPDLIQNIMISRQRLR